MIISYHWLREEKKPFFSLWEFKGSSFEQTWIPISQGCILPSLVEISRACFGKEDFLILSMYFPYFVIISPWKGVEPFIWKKLNSLYPGMHCAKFGWNWPSGSGEEAFLISSFRNYLPLKKGGALYLKNLYPLHPRMHCASLVEISPVVLEK